MQNQTTVTQALTRKYPEQVALVITSDPEGSANVMAVGWITIASQKTPMFLPGIDETAYTLQLIRESREFVIAYPHAGMDSETLYVGTLHGHYEDKLAKAQFFVQTTAVINAPLLSNAVVNFECRLVDIVRSGDCPLGIGEVVAAHVNADTMLVHAG